MKILLLLKAGVLKALKQKCYTKTFKLNSLNPVAFYSQPAFV